MGLPKTMRLKGHRSFDYIHKNSVKYHGKLMTIKITKSNRKILISHKNTSNLDDFKIAIAISKKVSKKAIARNRIRRVLQESLKKIINQKNNHKSCWLLVNLKSGCFCNNEKELLEEFQVLLIKSGLFK